MGALCQGGLSSTRTGGSTQPDDADGSAGVNKRLRICHLLLRKVLVHLADLQPTDGLEETRTVHAAGEAGVVEHLLGQLTIRLRARVTDLALDVADVVELGQVADVSYVELGQVADHLQDNDVLVEVLLAGGGELEARRSSLELAAVRNPVHLRALVEDVSGVKELVIRLLDETHPQRLIAVIQTNLVAGLPGGKHLDDDVRVLLLGVHVGSEVGLAALDGVLDLLQGPPALLHVALDLPRELDLVRDVEVDLEVEQLLHALVKERVQTLDDQDFRGLDLLRRVEEPGHVVVDRLLDGFALTVLVRYR